MKGLLVDAETIKFWPISVPKEPVSDLQLIRNGCEVVAMNIQKAIGGEFLKITPILGNQIGPVRGVGCGWSWHLAVIKNGKVFDRMTGIEGMVLDEYKLLFDYAKPTGNIPSSINFTIVSKSNLK